MTLLKAGGSTPEFAKKNNVPYQDKEKRRRNVEVQEGSRPTCSSEEGVKDKHPEE